MQETRRQHCCLMPHAPDRINLRLIFLLLTLCQQYNLFKSEKDCSLKGVRVLYTHPYANQYAETESVDSEQKRHLA